MDSAETTITKVCNRTLWLVRWTSLMPGEKSKGLILEDATNDSRGAPVRYGREFRLTIREMLVTEYTVYAKYIYNT